MTQLERAVVAHKNVSHLDAPAILTRKREVEARLGQLTKLDPEREILKAENEALAARLREIKEQTKLENTRRNFAGIGSPLYEAIVERLPPTHVAELETAALAKLADRERRSAEKRAAKAVLAPDLTKDLVEAGFLVPMNRYAKDRVDGDVEDRVNSAPSVPERHQAERRIVQEPVVEIIRRRRP